MSVHSRVSDRGTDTLSPLHLLRSHSNNSVTRLSSDLSSLVKLDLWAHDLARLDSQERTLLPSPLTGQFKELPNNRRAVSKDCLLAYQLYLDDINFVQDQTNYLSGPAAGHELPLALDDVLATPGLAPGYTLTGQLTSVHLSSLIYYAKHDRSGSRVIIKFLPNFIETTHMARFLNEWYVTLCSNPPQRHRLWSNDTIANAFIAAKGTFVADPRHKEELSRPVTLPYGIPGILYPQKFLNISYEKNGAQQIRMAMVYDDRNYKTILDHYNEVIRARGTEEKCSFHSASVRSVLSELSDSETRALSKQLIKTNLGSGEFDNLANRVSQVPKSKALMVDILRDVMSVVNTLAVCHELGFVHNGITSHHILRSTDLLTKEESSKHRVVLTGWDFSFSIAGEDSFLGFRKNNISEIPDLLPYMSPENTGETISLVDYRSDIYSVGIVLYELVVGCLPFISESPVRLRKMHLNQRPILPHVLGASWISDALSKIILKCLEKDPDDRYLEGHQLVKDLQEVVDDYLSAQATEDPNRRLLGPTVPAFKYDMTNLGKLPYFHSSMSKVKNYGVRKEIFKCFEDNADGLKYIVIKGEAGVGKTTVLEEVRGLAVSMYNFTVPWTYNCADMNTKYACIVHGLHSITKQILASSKENIAEWRSILTSQIDVDLSVLFPAIPELKTLLGSRYSSIRRGKNKNWNGKGHKSSSSSSLSNFLDDDLETENLEDLNLEGLHVAGLDEQALNLELKYKYIFKKFFSLIASKGLTIVLDDLHWCPPDEVMFIRDVVEYCSLQGENPSITVLATYRSSPPGSKFEKPLVDLSDVEKMVTSIGVSYYEFEMARLNEHQFNEFVGLSKFPQFLCDRDLSSIFKLCDGNRLGFHYLVRYLRLKNDDGKCLNELNDSSKKSELTTFIMDVVAKTLQFSLSEAAIKLLKFAAIVCVNGLFKISDLMVASSFSLPEIYEILQLCIEARIIVPSGIYYKIPFHLVARNDFPFELNDTVIWDLTTKTRYRFDHDIIQLCLLREIQESNEFEELHRTCGLRFMQKLSRERNVGVAAYLNMASHILEGCKAAKPEDHDKFYDALITGGRYALATSNLELALRFFEASLQFIRKDSKKRKLKNIITLCQCNYLLKNYTKSIEIISKAEEEFGKNNWTLVHLKVRSLIQLKQYKKGIKKALQGLESLEMEVSVDPHKCKIIAEKYFAQLPLSVVEIRSMKKLPLAKDHRFILIADLVQDIIGVTYTLSLTELRIAMLCQLVLLTFKFGYTTSCAIPLLHFANYFLQSNRHRSTIKACELAEVALAMISVGNGSSTSATEQINESYFIYMALFKQPIHEILKVSFMFNFESSTVVRPSDNSLALMVVWSRFTLSRIVGTSNITDGIREHLRLVIFDDENDQLIYSTCWRLWLMEVTLEQYMDQMKILNVRASPDNEFVFLANAVIWCAYEGLYDEGAEICLDRAYKLLRSSPISILHVEFYFYSATCLCFSHDMHPGSLAISVAKKIRSKFEFWSEAQSTNFKAKQMIVNACIKSTSATESSLAVLDLFEEAIDVASRNGLWTDVAWANHLCARWLLKSSSPRANTYAQNASSLYSTMNCEPQLARLRIEFPDLFGNHNWAGVAEVPESPRFKFGDVQVPKKFENKNRQIFNMKKLEPDSQISLSPVAESIKTVRIETDAALGRTTHQPSSDEWRQAIKLCLAISQSSSIDAIVWKLLESTLLFTGVDYGAIVLNINEHEPTIKVIGTINNLYKLEHESLSSRTDLVPYKLVIDTLLKGEVINRDDDPAYFDSNFGKDYYYKHNPCSSALCIPIKTSTVLGAIYLERHTYHREVMSNKPYFDNTKIDLLDLLCSQAAVSFSKSIVYNQMELAKKTAEDATSEKASFLANMSHEIRTPFNSLLACSVFLLDTTLNSAQKEYVQTIKDSALVTLSIIDGILAFSKIEHGSFTLENTPFSINETIESAIQVSSEQSEANDVALAYFNRCPEISTVVGDTTRVRQIIINLVGNAVKFTTSGSVKVILSADLITAGRYEFKITVEDTGIGIPEESKSKVFGAFSQVDGSSRRVYGGSGLGLAISKKLAEIMNGKIAFESKEGEGSTFCFSVPLEVLLTERPHVTKTQKVAIVSRALLKRASLQEFMEHYGAKVVLFDNMRDISNTKQKFDILMIEHECFPANNAEITRLKRESNCCVYLIAKFGLIITDLELSQMGVDQLVFTPIKLSKVKELLNGSFVKPKQESKAARTLLSERFPLSILVAEDNAINLRVALQHLKKLGYIVDHAKDGVEVLAKCESKLENGEKYDVIFMDIQMPNKDGIAATTELRELFAERGFERFLPLIIALTANVAGEDRGRCLECGMIDFVSKPILPEELERVLTRVGSQNGTQV